MVSLMDLVILVLLVVGETFVDVIVTGSCARIVGVDSLSLVVECLLLGMGALDEGLIYRFFSLFLAAV